jgi:hypothetical protein
MHAAGKLKSKIVIMNQFNASEACALNHHDADLEYNLQHTTSFKLEQMSKERMEGKGYMRAVSRAARTSERY